MYRASASALSRGRVGVVAAENLQDLARPVREACKNLQDRAAEDVDGATRTSGGRGRR